MSEEEDKLSAVLKGTVECSKDLKDLSRRLNDTDHVTERITVVALRSLRSPRSENDSVASMCSVASAAVRPRGAFESKAKEDKASPSAAEADVQHVQHVQPEDEHPKEEERTLTFVLPVTALRIQILVPSLWRHQRHRDQLRQSFLRSQAIYLDLEQHFFMGAPLTREADEEMISYKDLVVLPLSEEDLEMQQLTAQRKATGEDAEEQSIRDALASVNSEESSGPRCPKVSQGVPRCP
eukprot:Skav200207  [mRNA]  locus=scaffold1435:2965:21525:- [translate_table: standard]